MLVAFKSPLGPSPGAGCRSPALPLPQPLSQGFARWLWHQDLQTPLVLCCRLLNRSVPWLGASTGTLMFFCS